VTLCNSLSEEIDTTACSECGQPLCEDHVSEGRCRNCLLTPLSGDLLREVRGGSPVIIVGDWP